MSRPPTSCAADVAAVRAEPRDEAEQVTQVLRGEPVTVDERQDGWALIRTAYDYPGWVREEVLGGEEDRDWMTREGTTRSSGPVATWARRTSGAV